jgi:hypothetical protein
MLETGTLAMVDDEPGVFRVVEEAPGRAPTLWLLDRNRHWRAVAPRRRCPVCLAIWCRDHSQGGT